jgi:hypothetical protein
VHARLVHLPPVGDLVVGRNPVTAGPDIHDEQQQFPLPGRIVKIAFTDVTGHGTPPVFTDPLIRSYTCSSLLLKQGSS